MAQNVHVSRDRVRYTRVDYAALRFLLNRVPVSQIRQRVYTEDLLEERRLETDKALESWLENLKEDLVNRALKSNPHLAQSLATARQGGRWSPAVVDYLTREAEQERAGPELSDTLPMWFRPRVSRALAEEGLLTIKDLIAAIERWGSNWFRPIPRIGRGKAEAIQRWLSANENSLGPVRYPLEKVHTGQLELHSSSTVPLPLERIKAITLQLDGSQGVNRHSNFALISARNDLEAIHAYLYRARDNEHTRRSYRKELERFLLWCVLERRKALSSVLVDDCEAYKDFLSDLPEYWTGKAVPRTSDVWRPFQGPLSIASQKYAVSVLRTFFNWLIKVRYLGGNPWASVADPKAPIPEHPIQIQRALPSELWKRLSGPAGVFAECAAKVEGYDTAQFRLAWAAIELIGGTGVRRFEAAQAKRKHLNRMRDRKGLWELAVLGKGSKWRTVFITDFVVDLLSRHWEDRGDDFLSETTADVYLLSPVVIPPTDAAIAKHHESDAGQGMGFTANNLHRLVKRTFRQISADPAVPLEEEDRRLLSTAVTHDLRHTFATRLTKSADIVTAKGLLGHADLRTTSIYVQTEKARQADAIDALNRS